MSYLIGEKLTGGYGGADIIKDCTLSVDKGEIAVVVGPNGAGKSTAMKALLGMLNLYGGSVKLDGEDITTVIVFKTTDSANFNFFWPHYAPPESEVD